MYVPNSSQLMQPIHRFVLHSITIRSKFYVELFLISPLQIMRPVVAQRYECVTVNETGSEFDSNSMKSNIYLNLYFYLFALEWRKMRNEGSEH